MLQMNWSGLVSSFNSDTLKSTYWSCWFVLCSEPLSMEMPCGTERILGSTVPDFGCVSKLGICSTFLGYMRMVWCKCKSCFSVKSSYSLSDSSLELVVSHGFSAPCLCNLIFISGDVLFFIGEIVDTVSMVSNS